MKLASLDDGTRDGALCVVRRDGARARAVPGIARTLQDALERWDEVEGPLREVSDALGAADPEDDDDPGTFAVDPARLLAALPRAYQFIDGSAYVNHVELVRKARGAEPPETLYTDPLVYQAVSDRFLSPREPVVAADEAWGIDFEAEIGVITGDVPYRVREADAARHVRLLVLINDVSLRHLIPPELAKGFGFLVSKPRSALSPFAVTPDELGDAWRDARVHLPLRVWWNGERFGEPDAGPEMHFSFARLLEHVAQTRALGPGTLVGSGTVSNRDRAKGSCCIAEQRMLEKIDTGAFATPFMRFGDTVRIEMLAPDGTSLFGAIEQRVARWPEA